MHTITLDQDKQISLQLYRSDHAERIFSILDHEIGERVGWEVRSTVADLATHLSDDQLKLWSIFLDDILVGCVFLVLTIKKTNVWSKEMANIGYFIDKNYRRQGCISVAVPWVIQHAFSDMKLRRIKAGHLEGNAASKRVIEKNGFRLVGVERNYAKPVSSETYLNHYLYDIIPEDIL